VPLLIGQLKDVTNVFCPRQNRRYGGDVPYVRVFERYPEGDRPARRGKCFPAGHASGGFALIGLLWLRRSRWWRAGAIAAAMLVGWAMGTYQMLNGSHFLSHTITTMFIAVILTLLWRLLLPAADRHAAS
jgi:membrane-associated PAP2 superfamily phosphatase